MSTYRAEELARLAGTTARNIRAYRERGLLGAPRLVGRTGFYDDTHLARLRLLTRLLERGFTLANIADLLAAWEAGRPVAEVLGIEQVLTRPLLRDEPVVLTTGELAAMLHLSGEGLPTRRLAALGLAEPDGDRWLLPRPGLVRIGGELVAAGMEVDVVLDLAEHMAGLLEQVAGRFVRTAGAVFFAPESEPTAVEEVDRRVGALLTLAVEAVTNAVAWSLERQMAEELGRSVTARMNRREAVLA